MKQSVQTTNLPPGCAAATWAPFGKDMLSVNVMLKGGFRVQALVPVKANQQTALDRIVKTAIKNRDILRNIQ